jgi:DNA repair exonuclease SbcCD ATPase subunit
MGKKVKYSDHFERDFKKLVSDLRQEIKGFKDDIDSLSDTAKKVKASIEKTGKAYVDNKKKIEELSQAERELEAIEKQKIQTEKKLIDATAKQITQQSKQVKELIKVQEQTKRSNADLRQAAKLKNADARSIEGLRLKTNDLIKTRDRAIVTNRQERKEFTRLTKEIAKNQIALIKHDSKIKRSQRKVGDYTGALNKARNAFFALSAGILAGAGIVRAIGRATKAFIDFQLAMSKVAATTGIKKTSEEFKKLKQNALDLGKATQFTAIKVSELQNEYAKLGFSTDQILAATEATLDLALATGSELAESAEVAGNTLGGFGLAANETQRVVDVMAKSFSSSALDITKFQEAMKTAAPAARAIGMDVETTTALLGTLANAGISGSIAGSALRASFIKLNSAGLTLNEGLEQVKNSTDKLGTAEKLVGKLASTAFLVLAEGTETTAKLTEELNNAEGAAADMAATMSDNLAGDIELAKSAWEGFMIALASDSDGVLRNVTQRFTNFMSRLNTLITVGKDNWLAYNKILKETSSNTQALDLLNTQLLTNQSDLFKTVKKFGKETGDALRDDGENMKVILELLFIKMKSLNQITDENIKIFNQWGIGIETVSDEIVDLNKDLGDDGGLVPSIDEMAKKTKSAIKEMAEFADVIRFKFVPALGDADILGDLNTDFDEFLSLLDKGVDEANIIFDEFLKGDTFGLDDIESLINSTQQISSAFSTMFDAIISSRDESSNALLEANQTELDDLENRLNTELELRKAGVANDATLIEQRIADKEKEKTELERIAQEQAREQVRIQKGLIFANYALELSELALAAAKDPTNWLSGGLAGIFKFAATSAVASARFVANLASLPSFAEGTPFFGGIGTGTSDSNVVRVSRGERIQSAHENAIINGAAGRVVSNKDLVGYALAGMGFNDVRLLSELQKQTGIMQNRTERTRTGQTRHTKGKYSYII